MHRSVIHGFRMTGAKLKYVVPNFRPDFGVFEPIHAEALLEEIKRDEEIGVVALTSPTYDGLSSDIL